MDKIMDRFGVFDYVDTPDGKYEYTAAEIRSQFAAVVGNGVLKDAGGEFAASASGLSVTLAAGEAWLFGVHGVTFDAVTFNLDPVVSGMSRICSFVLDLDIESQLMGISVLVGSQASTPSDPLLTQSATRYQQLLYKAHVHDNGSVVLTNSRTFVTKAGAAAIVDSVPTKNSTNPVSSGGVYDAIHNITPNNIGAAGLDADNKVLADQASAKIVKVDASETIGLSRSGKHLLVNSNTNITITIPASATVAFPVGTEVELTDWIWGGRMTITPAAGVSIYWTDGSMNTKTSPNVGATCVGKYVQANVWLFGGF
mgnify:CR=1 FL=1